MAQSYASLFGTNGSGRQNRIGNLFGQQPAQGGQQGGQQGPPSYQQTFAQMQQQGQARPAPQAPQANAYQQFQGSQQAQAARAPMLQAVQQQLAQPTRFDTQAFQQIRQAQQANLQSEFGEQQRALNEDLARRGLSASTIGATGLGRLQGAQSRALADLDAQLLQQAAATQAQDRLAALQASGQFAELAGAQDLAQFEANRVGQAQRFQEALAAAQFGQGQSEFDRQQALQAAQLEQTGGLGGLDLQLRAALGMGGLDIDAARLAQQGELTGRELDLRAQQLQQEAALQGRSLSLDEARLAAQQSQFGQEQALRERLGIGGLDLDRQRLTQQGEQFALEQALRERLGIGGLDLDRQRLSQQGQQFALEQALRERLGVGELDIRGKESQANLALQQNQLMLQLAQALGGLSPEILAQLFGKKDDAPGGGNIGGGDGSDGTNKRKK